MSQCLESLHCLISFLALCHQPSPIILQLSINGTSTIYTRLASRSSYTLPPIRSNYMYMYGKFSIKFKGAKIWNSLRNKMAERFASVSEDELCEKCIIKQLLNSVFG